ncbi:MAG: L,D-transpeptidase [Bacteroidales bacterium]
MKENNENLKSSAGSGVVDSELVQIVTGFFRALLTNKTAIKITLITLKVFAVILSVILFFTFFFYLIPFIQDPGTRDFNPRETTAIILSNDREYRKQITSLKAEVQRLSGKYRSLTPGQSYLVINTTGNRFYLYRNRKLVREGFCSSGSYIRLVTPEGSREWIFRTPRGKFWIQQKVVKPLWVKPDWAFIEEGLPVPPPDDESRYERGVLGDYAMSLGDGYLIHGTLYKRFLGMPVTHGCIRLNDEDLKAIFNTLNVGSKVYIF